MSLASCPSVVVRAVKSLALVWALGSSFLLGASRPALVWHSESNRFDAAIRDWTLPQMLSKLAKVTGWTVKYESKATDRISTAFRNLPVDEALGRMLGPLSYSLESRTNSLGISFTELLIYRTSAANATDLAKASDSPTDEASQKIVNELIVALNPAGTNQIDELSKKLNAEIIGKLDSISAYRLKFTNESSAEAALAQLKKTDGISAVENNLRFDEPSFSHSQQVEPIGTLNLRPKLVGSKDEIIVGLIDTSVQSLGPEYDSFILPGLSVAGPASTDNELRHGTSMAAIILKGVASLGSPAGGSRVRIRPIDVYGRAGQTTSFDIARGLYLAAEGDSIIYSLSLGGSEPSSWLHDVIADITRQGGIVLASAGNSPVASASFPAAFPEVIAVTAGERNGRLANYANFGSFVDVMAPGSAIVPFGGVHWAVRGTSTATAFASGVGAGVLSQPGSNPATTRNFLQTAMPFPQPPPQFPGPIKGR